MGSLRFSCSVSLPVRISCAWDFGAPFPFGFPFAFVFLLLTSSSEALDLSSKTHPPPLFGSSRLIFFLNGSEGAGFEGNNKLGAGM